MSEGTKTQHLAWWIVASIETVPLLLLIYVVAMAIVPVVAKKSAWSPMAMSLLAIAVVVRFPAWWSVVSGKWWSLRWLVLDVLVAVSMAVLYAAMMPVPDWLMTSSVGSTMSTMGTEPLLMFIIGVVVLKVAAVVLFPMTIHRTITRADDRVEKMTNRWENYSTPGPTTNPT